MGRQDDFTKIKGWAQKEYATHVMSPGECVSRRFRRSDGRSHYHFNLTWVPGTLSLSGDVGEISLVHYAALKEFRSGCYWLSGASYEYLVGKAAGDHREYDREGTVDFLVEMANSQIIDALKQHRRELSDYREASAPGRARFRGDYDEWFELGMVGAPPLFEEYEIPDRRDYVTEFTFEMVKGYEGCFPGHYPDKIDDRRLPADCHMWFAMWKELDVTDNPRDIFTAKGRREIRRALEQHLDEGGREHAAEFCSQIGMSDYYGSEKFADRTIWQIEALQHGARMILAEFAAADRKWRHFRRAANFFKGLRIPLLRGKTA